MENNPLVSVICLCFNHQDYVIECLDSILKQDYSPIEIIIADDYSTDNSKTIIKEWIIENPKAIFIENRYNQGNTKTFNKALKKAKGEFIIDLATDDKLMPFCVSNQVNAFKKSSLINLGAVFGNAVNIDEKGDFCSYYFPVHPNLKVIQEIKSGDIYSSILSGSESMCSVSAMFRKSVFDELQGYDENLAYEDLDFWIRASRKYDFQFIDQILVQKRILSNSLGTNFFRKNNKINYSTYQVLKKVKSLNKTKEENKAVLKRIHFEIKLNFKSKNYILSLKYIYMELYFRLKQTFSKVNT